MKVGDCVKLFPKIWDNSEPYPNKMENATGDMHWGHVGIIVSTASSAVFDHVMYNVLVDSTQRIFMKDEMELINDEEVGKKQKYS